MMNIQNRNFGITNNFNHRNNYPINQQTSPSKPNNILFRKNFQQNSNLNLNNNIIQKDNDTITKALMIINNEFKKKDAKIKELEQKIQELQLKIQSLTNTKNPINNYNNENNDNYNMTISMNSYKKCVGNELNASSNKRSSSTNNMNNFGFEKNYVSNNSTKRNNMFNQKIMNNNLNYNSDCEKIVRRKFGEGDNLSRSNDNSALTYNNGQANSKSDVKNYLKDVKSKVDPAIFKEFIKNIKLLTAKNNPGINRNMIIEKVRILFGEEHKELFIQFENIIGVRQM